MEDNPAEAELASLAFSTLSLENDLVHFSDGQSFLDYLKQQPDDPQAYFVLLDLNMPSPDGRDLLRALKGLPAWSGVPVAVFSSSMYRKDIEDCYQLGADAFVTKPFDMSAFYETIRRMVNFWMRSAIPDPVQA